MRRTGRVDWARRAQRGTLMVILMKIVHAQTVISQDDLDALKEKSGESTTKDALAAAVQHYLECEYTDVGDMWTKRMEKVLSEKQKKEKQKNE